MSGSTAALIDAIRRFDRATSVSEALRLLEGGMSITDLYNELSDLLVDTGAGWQHGRVEIWQEHLTSGIVRSIVESCATIVDARAPKDRRATVVLAAPDEEYHDLGLRMLADRFTLAGWQAHFLGADAPVGDVIRAVSALGADAVALSASTHFHRVSLNQYVNELAAALPQVRIWVGGPAFALEQHGWPEEMMLNPRSVPGPEEL